MPAASPSRTDWDERLASASTSTDGLRIVDVEEAETRITRHPYLQRWLRDASLEAGAEVRSTDAMAQSRAHGRMQRKLKAQFPALVEAIQATTEGCGTLMLYWRPLSPGYSQLQITFPGEDDPDVFCALQTPALSTARRALEAIAETLPAGRPFPNRPNIASGVLSYEGRCLGVRYLAHLREDDTTDRGVVLLPGDEATEEHPVAAAARGIVAYFAPEERTQWYER